MRKNWAGVLTTMAFAVAGTAAALAQKNSISDAPHTQAPANTDSAATPAAAPQAAYQSQDFAPGFDDLMTMLVQPRHIKLFYAGKEKNWELAAAESRELRQSFGRIVSTIPNYQGNDVDQATATFLVSGLNAVDAAVSAASPVAFAKAYKQLTDGCNACHTYMEHPFLVIRIPTSPIGYPNQLFKPVQ